MVNPNHGVAARHRAVDHVEYPLDANRRIRQIHGNRVAPPLDFVMMIPTIAPEAPVI
jgi:hypothetical protein